MSASIKVVKNVLDTHRRACDPVHHIQDRTQRTRCSPGTNRCFSKPGCSVTKILLAMCALFTGLLTAHKGSSGAPVPLLEPSPAPPWLAPDDPKPALSSKASPELFASSTASGCVPCRTGHTSIHCQANLGTPTWAFMIQLQPVNIRSQKQECSISWTYRFSFLCSQPCSSISFENCLFLCLLGFLILVRNCRIILVLYRPERCK